MLTTLPQLKAYLGVTGVSKKDEILESILEAASAAFANLIDRNLELTAYVDYYSGKGSKVLVLNEYPVTTVAGVWVDSTGYWGASATAFDSNHQYVSGLDYALVKDGRGGNAATGRLYCLRGVWPPIWLTRSGVLGAVRKPGAGNVKVSYTAGYDEIPMDVQRAIWEITAALLASKNIGRPFMSERYEEYQYLLASLRDMFLQIGSANQVAMRYKRTQTRHEVLG